MSLVSLERLGDYTAKSKEYIEKYKLEITGSTLKLTHPNGTTIDTANLPTTEGALTDTTYSLTKSGSTIKLTPSSGAAMTITDDDTKYTLSLNTAKNKAILKDDDGNPAGEINIVSGLKANGSATLLTGEIELTKDMVGLSSVENKSVADINASITKANVTTALGGEVVMKSEVGSAKGVAPLDVNSKIPTTYLPSFVSEMKEFANRAAFPAAGDSSIIYIASDTGALYRWSGTAYVQMTSGGSVDGGLALGETSSTAFAGDKGKISYDHAMAKGSAFTNNLYKITTNAEGHVTNATAVTKETIVGYGVVDEDNIVTTISSTSTDTTIPSAKAVYTYIADLIEFATDDEVNGILVTL